MINADASEKKPSKTSCMQIRLYKKMKSINGDSVVTCDEIVDLVAKFYNNVSINLNDKKATCKMDNFYILLIFFISNHIVIRNHYSLLLLHNGLTHWLKQREILSY